MSYAASTMAALFIAAEDTDGLLRMPVPPGLRFGLRSGADLPKRNPDGGATLPLLRCPFGAVVLAHGPVRTILPALQDVADRLPMDVAASALLFGTEHVVKPGEGDVLVTMLVRRQDSFSPAAFRKRWLLGHAPFGLRIPVSGYRQLHADPAPVPGLPATDRFDGAGMVLFRDPDHVASARATPEIALDATRDEMQFIDHSASMLAMFRLL